MEKLELKHLAGYLPYDLNIEFERCIYPRRKEKELLKPKHLELSFYGIKNSFKIKPILHPLSDLTKVIEVNGEKFVPLELLNNMLFTKHSKLEYFDSEFCKGAILFSTNISGFNILSMGEKIQKLYEWHFDIHGLIEKELAVDINTLK